MQEHIIEKLSAYLHHELPKEERQAIAEHLLQCDKCRNEHDRIKLGATLAAKLQRTDAPQNLWNEIEKALDEKPAKQALLTPGFSFFNLRGLTAMAAILLIASGLFILIYSGLFRKESGEIVKNIPAAVENTATETPQPISSPKISTNQNTNIQANINSNTLIRPLNTTSDIQVSPKISPVPPSNKSTEAPAGQSNLPTWNVETIAGTPQTGNRSISEKGKLAVGQFLETDANSRAKIQVANIGQVEIAPNSRVQLVKTQSTEHRLSLERGVLQAKIFAPPRLFIVDTPSAVAVDLGCEYKLEVDKDGNSRLHVTLGYVALERDGRESIVPAGAICLTKRGKGLGTPFSEDSSAEFQDALEKFDFRNGGSSALETIIRESNFYDTLSLWHLLSRTNGAEREKVFHALAKYVEPPVGTTRDGILKLDKRMLDQWWKQIESIWFE